MMITMLPFLYTWSKYSARGLHNLCTVHSSARTAQPICANSASVYNHVTAGPESQPEIPPALRSYQPSIKPSTHSLDTTHS
ncbi:hypothetical protein B0J17DRAFT_680957 [Rhizoctonia solani]|nr:hypothetical protein B0J17DRAFT_680957 [Rhizoctonia solani]